MTLTIDAPAGGCADRLCHALRDMGYTVHVAGRVPGTRRMVVDVVTPYGEVDGKPCFLGGSARRRRSA